MLNTYAPIPLFAMDDFSGRYSCDYRLQRNVPMPDGIRFGYDLLAKTFDSRDEFLAAVAAVHDPWALNGELHIEGRHSFRDPLYNVLTRHDEWWWEKQGRSGYVYTSSKRERGRDNDSVGD